jgi:sn1-specific diacylglycerol lipase
MSCLTSKYWQSTFQESCQEHGLWIRIYLVGIISLICVNLFLILIVVNRSAQGGITDTQNRWLVAPLLTIKLVLIIPETLLNVFATVWAFCGSIQCEPKDFYTKTVIEGESAVAIEGK